MGQLRLFITRSADRDLDEIYDYVALVRQSPVNAGRLIRRLRVAIHSLSDHPGHAIIDEPPFSRHCIRRFTVANHVIYYLVDRRRHLLAILAVLYGGRLWQRILPARLQEWWTDRPPIN